MILGYHRVVENFQQYAAHNMAPMLISVRTLEAHLDWLGRTYEFVSLQDLSGVMSDGRRRKPSVAITFDDGYGDIYKHAFPLFKRKGIPFTVFVVTDLVGTDHMQMHDEIYLLLAQASCSEPMKLRGVAELIARLERGILLPYDMSDQEQLFSITRRLIKAMRSDALRDLINELKSIVTLPEDIAEEYHSLKWDMLQEMQQAGMTIGSHTRSHALLPNENREKTRDETRASRQVLEERLGIRIEHFAYPDGRFNRESVEAVAAAGYRYAYTTFQAPDPLYPNLTLPRRILWEKSCAGLSGNFSPSVMSCQVSGIFDIASHNRIRQGASS